MKKITYVGAGSDLGVHVDGANLGSIYILDKLEGHKISVNRDVNYQKSKDKNDMNKNFDQVNAFNEELYKLILKENNFCLTIGGDHSIAMGSALASIKKHPNLGVIWIDAHLDYIPYGTTITGNMHGSPLATIDGKNPELSHYHDGEYFKPENSVVVGYRSNEADKEAEQSFVQSQGVIFYTTDDIKEYGVSEIMDKAFALATKNTNGVHISFDLDVIDPTIATGVSVPEINGLNIPEVNAIIDYLKTKKDLIKSMDLVEYNPLNDRDNQTLDIALHIINEFVND